jgi:hypothetical protein
MGLVGVVGLAACASGPTSTVAPASSGAAASLTSEPSTSAVVAEPAETWVAVLDTADDPARLNGPRTDVLHELGNVLEGSVIVSPGECLEGLPEELRDGYVLAIQRDTREDVRSLVSLLSGEPSFTGHVTIVCSD